MAETKKYLRYVPGTDQFETLEVSEKGTTRGQVNTREADKLRKSGHTLVSDEQWAKVNPPSEAEVQRNQVVERSGTGAPGMVYVERNGAPVLMPLRSAEQQRLRVISADEARTLGQAMEAREEVVARSGTGAPGMVYAERDGAPVLLRLEDAERQKLRVISADEARELGTALEAREEAAQPASSGPGIWGQIAQATMGATPQDVARRITQQAETDELMRLSDPSANPAQALVQGTGLGYAPAVAAPRGREFSGFRGDPAVVVRQPDGTNTPGGVNPTPYAASGARGGSVPAVEQPRRALAPEDAAIPATPTPGAPASAQGVRFSPGGGGGSGRKEIGDAFAEQQKAAEERAQLEVEKAAAEVARRDVEIAETRKRQAEEQERMAVQLKAVDDERAKYSTMVASLSEPSGEVNPSRWWNSRDTGQKIAAIASAFMTGFAGRPNVVLDLINKDIDAQRFNLERADRNKARAVDAQRGVYAAARERFGDEILAVNAARAASAELAQKIVERETAGFKGQEAMVRKRETTAAIMQAKVEAQQAFDLRAGQLALQRLQAATEAARLFQTQQKAVGGGVAESGQVVDLSTLTPEQKKRAVTVAPGRAILALNEDAAKKASDGLLSGQQTLRILDKAISLRREYGPEVLPTEGKKQLQSVGLELIGALNRRNKFGALDKGTQELLEQMAGGDLTSIGQVIPVLEQLRAGVAQDVGDEFQAYTGQPFGGVASFQPRQK